MSVIIILKSGEKIEYKGKSTPEDVFKSMSADVGTVLSLMDNNGKLTGFIKCSEVAAVIESLT